MNKQQVKDRLQREMIASVFRFIVGVGAAVTSAYIILRLFVGV